MEGKLTCPYCGRSRIVIERDERLHQIETGYARCLDCDAAFEHSRRNIDYYSAFISAFSSLRTNESKALEMLQALAKRGYAPACRQLGTFYTPYEKHGFSTRSAEKAKYWFEQGIALKDAASANRLGVLYWKGEGIAKDINKAYGCWSLAMNLCKEYETNLQAKIKENIDTYLRHSTQKPTPASDKSEITREEIVHMALAREPKDISGPEAKQTLRNVVARIIPGYLGGMRVEDAILRCDWAELYANITATDIGSLLIFLKFLCNEITYARNIELVEELKTYIIDILYTRMNT